MMDMRLVCDAATALWRYHVALERVCFKESDVPIIAEVNPCGEVTRPVVPVKSSMPPVPDLSELVSILGSSVVDDTRRKKVFHEVAQNLWATWKPPFPTVEKLTLRTPKGQLAHEQYVTLEYEFELAALTSEQVCRVFFEIKNLAKEVEMHCGCARRVEMRPLGTWLEHERTD